MTVGPAIETRPELLERLAKARAETDRLFRLLKSDSIFERPIAERHRLIFYLGHLEAFDWNLLHHRLPGVSSFDPTLDKLFAFGIDPLDGGLPSDEPGDWPDRARIGGYNNVVRLTLDEALHTHRSWCGAERPDVLLNVAIEHRLMHAETLAYLLHRLPLESKCTLVQPNVPARGRIDEHIIRVPAGRATLGLSREEAVFGWDNEFESHVVNVPSFAIDAYKITNEQFLDFVYAGGYRDRRLWADADWAWKTAQGIEHPAIWKRDGGDYFMYRGMFADMPLPPDWPVYVSHAEANAYASWKGKRLPTEAEWHRAAYGTSRNEERAYPWGDKAPGPQHGYFDLHRWDPVGVNAFPDNQSYWGVRGMLANGWEWTSSPFEPFTGFEPFSFYRGYSADFFDGRHYVLKGGSQRTEHCMLRRSFRNWFQPHYPYVYAGFRCASD